MRGQIPGVAAVLWMVSPLAPLPWLAMVKQRLRVAFFVRLRVLFEPDGVAGSWRFARFEAIVRSGPAYWREIMIGRALGTRGYLYRGDFYVVDSNHNTHTHTHTHTHTRANTWRRRGALDGVAAGSTPMARHG